MTSSPSSLPETQPGYPDATHRDIARKQVGGLDRPEFVYLILASVLGLLFVFATPPLQVPDELNHFFRAYQISEGRLWPQQSPEGVWGGHLPRSLATGLAAPSLLAMPGHRDKQIAPSQITALLGTELNPEDRIFYAFPNTSVYFPLMYLPQACGTLAGRIIGLSPLGIFYAARIFNLAAWIALVFIAIRLIPFMKWPMLILCLMPLHLSLSASASGDVPVNALAYLTFAWLLHLAFGPRERITRKDLVWTFLLCGILALLKQTYVTIPLLFLLIPPGKIGTPHKFFSIFMLLLISMALLGGLWVIAFESMELNLNVEAKSSEQLRFNLSHPVHYTIIVLRSFFYLDSLVLWMGRLGWQELKLAEFLVWLHILLLFAAVWQDRPEKPHFSWKARGLIVFALLTGMLLLTTALYMTWNPIGNEVVRGIRQGRYFLPLFPLFLLLFFNLRANGRTLAIMSGLLVGVGTLLSVIRRYYG